MMLLFTANVSKGAEERQDFPEILCNKAESFIWGHNTESHQSIKKSSPISSCKKKASLSHT